MYSLRQSLFHYFLIGSLLFLVGCQPVPPAEPQPQKNQQMVERHTLETQYDQLIHAQRHQPAAPHSIASIAPQQAHELLETAQTLYNIDSNRFIHLDTLPQLIAPQQNRGLLFTVHDYDQAYTNIQALTKDTGIRLVSETEQTTDYHRGVILQLEAPAHQLDQTVKRLEGLATVLRKKERWQPSNNNYHLTVKSQLVIHQQRLNDLSAQLNETKPLLADQLLLKETIADLSQEVENTLLQLQAQATTPNQSVLTVAFYETTPPPAHKPQSFSADFSNNLKAGWVQFKGFLLQAALVWPYIVMGLLLLIVMGLIVGNNRRKDRQFKLQLLHKQQPVVQPVVVPNPPQV